jgi:DNA invertase Pin-like site-specific DNA recombinase
MDADASGVKPVDIYARVSRLKRDEKREMSIEGQVAVCRARLIELNLPVGKVLVDPGRSAWNPNIKRLAWDELMDRLEARISRGAIMFDLERFARIPKDGERVIDLADLGILILDSESEYDLTTPNGKKSFRDAINAAAYYSDRLSTRVQRGLRLKAADGVPNGPGRRTFGFELDRVTVREEEAEIIRELTRRFLDWEMVTLLVKDLDERGIRTALGNRWEATTMRRLLTRDLNCGRITHTDAKTGVKSVVGRLPGKPIVAEEDFDRACEIFASRGPQPKWLSYLCSSAAVCGRCGHMLHGHPETTLKAYPDGSIRRSYWCSRLSGGCGKTKIDQRGLEEAAGVLTVEVLSDPGNALAIEAAAHEIAREVARLDLAITEAEDVAETLAERLGRGELPLARYNVAIKPLDARIARLKAERDALPDPSSGPVPQQPVEAGREQWQRRWDVADDKEKRDLLNMALRGKHLVVAPAERGLGSYDLADIIRRVTIG